MSKSTDLFYIDCSVKLSSWKLIALMLWIICLGLLVTVGILSAKCKSTDKKKIRLLSTHKNKCFNCMFSYSHVVLHWGYTTLILHLIFCFLDTWVIWHACGENVLLEHCMFETLFNHILNHSASNIKAKIMNAYDHTFLFLIRYTSQRLVLFFTCLCTRGYLFCLSTCKVIY